jgi:hypothetical protein
MQDEQVRGCFYNRTSTEQYGAGLAFCTDFGPSINLHSLQHFLFGRCLVKQAGSTGQGASVSMSRLELRRSTLETSSGRVWLEARRG